MVWAAKGDHSQLSYEAFLAIAAQEGIDLSDPVHNEKLYEDALGVLASMAELASHDVGSAEPADIYTPGSEVA